MPWRRAHQPRFARRRASTLGGEPPLALVDGGARGDGGSAAGNSGDDTVAERADEAARRAMWESGEEGLHRG